MATIQRITKSRKSKFGDRRCDACGTVIPVGDPYKWFRANRFAPLLTRCVNCPDWKPSEMEPTALSTAYAGQESAHEALDALDPSEYVDDDGVFQDVTFNADVASAVEPAAEAAQECADEFQESLDNIPEGLNEGPTAELLQEKIDALESWRDDLESWSATTEFDHDDESPGTDEYTAAVESFVESVIDEAREVVDGLEL